MFAARYFAPHYFPARYFAEAGATGVVSFTATGSILTGGTAALDRTLALGAVGAILTNGSASLAVTSNVVHFAATGSILTGGTAALARARTLAALGAVATDGSSSLARALRLGATGAITTLGTANLFVLVPGGPAQVALSYFPSSIWGTIERLPYGQPVRLTATFMDEAGALVDPGMVSFWLKAPDGTVTEYVYGTDVELVKPATGVYYVDWPNDAAGLYAVRFDGTGGNPGAVEGQYVVDASLVV